MFFFVSYFDFTQFLFIKTFTVFAEVRLIKSEQNDTAKLQFYFLFDKFFSDIFMGGGGNSLLFNILYLH